MNNRKQPLYWNWIATESIAINSDGCSAVPDFYLKCCQQHDLSYYYARCPRSAYRAHITGSMNSWADAKTLTQSAADINFRRCIQQNSKLGRFSPMSWWRWLALKVVGKKAWNSHTVTHKD